MPFNCATGLKYPLPPVHRTLDINEEIDFHGTLISDRLPGLLQIRKERYAVGEQVSALVVDATPAKEVRMGKLLLIAGVASALWTFPAAAGDEGNAIPSKPEVTLAQLDVCIGPDCRDRDRVYRERERRYYNRYDDDWRYRRGDRGCRDVTIRERRGDEVVVRHVRRCD